MAGILSKESVVQKLRQIDPYEFEGFVAEVWEQRGYDTTVRSGSGDRGIDVVAEYGSEKVLIQVKRYGKENKVGSQTVRKYATLYQQVDDADQVVIVSSGFFTSGAEQLASDLDVEAVDVNDLYQIVDNCAADVAVDYLSGKAFSEVPGETKPTASDVFGDANRFKRTASEQGIFEGCPSCGRDSLFLGHRADDGLIELKCSNCDSHWIEMRKKTGWWIFSRMEHWGFATTSGRGDSVKKTTEEWNKHYYTQSPSEPNLL